MISRFPATSASRPPRPSVAGTGRWIHRVIPPTWCGGPRLFALLMLAWAAMAGRADPAEPWVAHVDAMGNDASPGTAVEPFRSLARALEAAARRPPGPGTIRLRAGIYRIGETIPITAEHSGPTIGRLTIEGQPGTVLGGFLPVPAGAWSRPDPETLARLPEGARPHALALDLAMVGQGSPGEFSRRGFNAVEREKIAPWLLYAGERRLTLAQWPDDGTARPEAVIERGPTRDGEGSAQFYDHGGAFRFRHPRLSQWAAEKDLWLEGVLCQDWVWSFNRIDSIDPSTGAVRLAFGEVDGIRMEEWMHPWFRVVNALCEISRPGEYHLDAGAGRIIAWPSEPAEVWQENARLLRAEPPLVHIRGAADLIFAGLIFEGSRGHLLQADDTRDLAIDRCSFRHAAGYGAVLDGMRIAIRDCQFEDLGAGGLILSGGNEVKLENSGHRVEYCDFRRLAWWNRVFRPAIMLGGVGHHVHGCRFEDLPHMAIEVKGNNFIIEENLFRRVCTGFRDMGAIYLNLGENPLRRGTIVRANVFTDIGRQGGRRSAVYIDNGTNGVLVRDNLFDGIGGEAGDWTVMVHGGDHNTIEGNWFIDCPLPFHMNFFFNTWGKEMYPRVRESWEKQLSAPEAAARLAAYPELKDFLTTDRVTPGHNVFRNNRFRGREGDTPAFTVSGGPSERLQSSGNEEDHSPSLPPQAGIWDKVLRSSGPRDMGSKSTVTP